MSEKAESYYDYGTIALEKTQKQEFGIVQMSVIDKFFENGTIYHPNGYKTILYHSDIKGQELEYLIPGCWAVNLADKRLWIGDKNSKPIEIEVKIK